VREAAAMEADFFTRADAEFALWDLHVRERDFARATELAQKLAQTFPDNKEVAQYLARRTTSRATR
jgi:hypothetical protein